MDRATQVLTGHIDDQPRKVMTVNGVDIRIPMPMWWDIHKLGDNLVLDDAELLWFNNIREGYDFAYWAAIHAPVRSKTGEIVQFYMNEPQEKIVRELERQRLQGKPIRLIILKSRQFGSSTLIYTYFAWWQLRLHTGLSSWVIGLDQSQSSDLVQRYDAIRDNLGFTLERHGGSDKTRRIVERDCFVSVGTVERPNAPSGRSAQLCHMSEIGKWPSTQVVSAERMAQNMGAMVPELPNTCIVLESTAQAMVGTYFMDICNLAMQGQSEYGFVFVGAVDDPTLVSSPADPGTFSEDEEAWYKAGASPEHIGWRRMKLRTPEYSDPWRLMEEYPITPQDAFQLGGNRVFKAAHVVKARKGCSEATRYQLSDLSPGKMDLDLIRNDHGHLYVWELPAEGEFANRYVAGFDVGGVWEGADWSVVRIFDRMVPDGLALKLVAEYVTHLDHDLVAWDAARLANYYHRALLVPEINSLIGDAGTPDDRDMDHGTTVIDRIKDHYYNIYQRRVYDTARKDYTYKLGFHTNKQTKPILVTGVKEYLRDELLWEQSFPATYEYDAYIKHPDGTYGAQHGRHDDRVIATGLAIVGHQSLGQAVDLTRPEKKYKPKAKPATGWAAY